MDADSSAQCNASLRVARRSGCPSPRWQDEIAPILSARLANGTSGEPFCYINVGANKGYNVAETLQRYHSRGAGPRTSEAWHKELLKGSPKGMRVKYGCGLCNPCKQPPPPKRYHVPVEVHALEMVDVNAQALRRLFGVFAVPGHAWHLAVSNFTGTAQYRAAPFVGLEHYELGKGTNRQVACTTLDAFAAAQLRPGQTVDLLSVDTEGQDALVLEGARTLLASRRVTVLEFEFIGRGYWRLDHPEQRRLKHVLEALEGFGYRCFWQGEQHAAGGRLARANGRYWCDAFQFRARSNLVCSHMAQVLAVFEGLAVGPNDNEPAPTAQPPTAQPNQNARRRGKKVRS